MSRITTALCILSLLLCFEASAQEINSTNFMNGLIQLVEDARRGFPLATGNLTEDNRYEKQYTSNLSLFNLKANNRLQYVYAQENTYSPSTPEYFYFVQSFLKSNPANQFMNDSAEKILDEVAKTAGLKKVKVKQQSKGDRVYAYQSGGKSVFSFAQFKENGQATIKIYSPYRPGDVQVDNLLGCMAFFANSTNFMYIVPVYGAAVSDKAKMVSDVYRKMGYSESSYTYQWFPGRSANSLENEYGKQKYVKMMLGYAME